MENIILKYSNFLSPISCSIRTYTRNQWREIQRIFWSKEQTFSTKWTFGNDNFRHSKIPNKLRIFHEFRWKLLCSQKDHLPNWYRFFEKCEWKQIRRFNNYQIKLPFLVNYEINDEILLKFGCGNLAKLFVDALDSFVPQ